MSVLTNLDPMGKYVIKALRRLFLYWPARRECRHLAERGKDLYLCAKCNIIYIRKDTHVDHVIPVIDPQIGFVDWNTYVERLFCQTSNLVILCRECHGKKTREENTIRRDKARPGKARLKSSKLGIGRGRSARKNVRREKIC